MTSFWDSLTIGEEEILGTHHFSAEEIVRFAREFDPQPFHLDEAAAKASLLGGLCASGWHNCAVMMRLLVETNARRAAAWVAAGNPAPRFGPSPGTNDIRWPRPVFAGDTLTYRRILTGKRVSTSRPGWGVVETTVEAANQKGEPALSLKAVAFLGTE